MNKKDLKKLSKSQLVKLLLKQEEKRNQLRNQSSAWGEIISRWERNNWNIVVSCSRGL